MSRSRKTVEELRVTISARVSGGAARELNELAQSLGRTRSQVMEYALREYLARRGRIVAGSGPVAFGSDRPEPLVREAEPLVREAACPTR